MQPWGREKGGEEQEQGCGSSPLLPQTLVGNSCLTRIYLGGSKSENNRIPKDFFFSVFSGGIFHRNVVLEGVAGIPVFGRYHRIFLQEFLRHRNSCICT